MLCQHLGQALTKIVEVNSPNSTSPTITNLTSSGKTECTLAVALNGSLIGKNQFLPRQLKRAGWGLRQSAGVDAVLLPACPSRNHFGDRSHKWKSPPRRLSCNLSGGWSSWTGSSFECSYRFSRNEGVMKSTYQCVFAHPVEGNFSDHVAETRATSFHQHL